MDDDQQFCLRWNNHQSTLISVFDTLLEKGIHVDCTLAAEGQTLKAHKVVLSACSPYFEAVLSQQYDKHPIIILKDVKFAELRAMMDYMYRGEVNISQDQLGALLKAAESLQIKGLSDSKPPPQPPLNTPHQNPTVPRAVSPPPKLQVPVGRTASPCAEELSREGSLSPARRKRKKRRTSLSPAPLPLPLLLNNNPPTPPDTHNDSMAKLKLLQPNHETNKPVPVEQPLEPATLEPKVEPQQQPPENEEDDGEQPVEDLTLDEGEGEYMDSEGEHAGTSHSLQDSATGFAWHLDRSQDEMTVGQDGQRDSTERVTRSTASATAPRTPQPPQPTQPTQAILKKEGEEDGDDPVIDVDTETSTGEVGVHEAAVLSLLLADPSGHHRLQQQQQQQDSALLMDEAFLRNNNVITKEEFYPKCESEEEFEEDDFDDILLPDESEVFGSGLMEGLCKEEEGVRRSRGRSGAEPLQQFECRHCGKRYRWKSTLRRHESVECGGKPPAHACPYCMYRAKQRGNLGVHIRKHHNTEWNAFANTKLRKTKKLTEVKNV